MTNRTDSHRISSKTRNLLLIATITLITGAGFTWMFGSSASTEPGMRVSPATPRTVAVPANGLAAEPVRSELMTREFTLLAAKAGQEGMVRVIVGLQTITEPTETANSNSTISASPELIESLQSSLLTRVSGYDTASVKRYRYLPYLALKVSPGGLESLRRDSMVVTIQEDGVLSPALTKGLGRWAGMQVPEGGLNGEGQSVVVVDTGIDKREPALAGKISAEACFSTSDAGAGINSLCPPLQPSPADDSALPCTIDSAGCEQGTNVAGILAGRSSGFSGIAPQAKLISIQVFSNLTGKGQCANGKDSCIGAFHSDLISALERVFELRQQHSIAAVNLALAGGRFTGNCDENLPATKSAIDLLRGAGIATVVASGSGGYVDALAAPACISTAVSVGATRSTDGSRELVDPATNSSGRLHLLAPGEPMPSSELVGISARGAGRTGGTSMAAPHVAGFFALARQKRPGISVGTVVELLKSTGREILDQRNGLSIPRIQIDRAIDGLNSVAAVPATPDGLVATTISATQIDLVWNDVATETAYEIWRRSSLNGTATKIADMGANVTSFENTGLTPGRTYFYYVIATNADGSSQASDTVRATTQPIPLAPSNLTATVASPTQINLSWTDNATNEKNYSIRRSPTTGGPYVEVAQVAPNISTFMNVGLVSGTTYYYVVVAINGGTESTPSNEATASTPEIVPAAPGGLTVTVQDISKPNELALNWTDNSNNETGFRIERRTATGEFTVISSTVPKDTTSFTNTGLLKNTQYFYRIFAFNSVGDSLVSNVANGTTPDTPPNAPTGLTATSASATQINLSWTDNSDNEVTFRIFRKLGAGGSFGTTPIATVAANTTTYQDSGLVDNTQYFYEVRATNSGGDSAGIQGNATTLPLPDPPTGLIINPGTATKLNLSWTDNSSGVVAETGFRIKRSATSGGPYTVVKTVPQNSNSAEDTGLTPETTYYYVVVAFNTNGESEPSNEASRATAALPAKPTSVVATPNSSSQITVTWNENVTDDQGFEVWRKSTSGDFVLLSTTQPDIKTYTDNSNISGKQSYTYQVITVNPNGKSLPAFSTPVTTPAGAPAAPSMLTATPASGTAITLAWIDNSETETEYRVERSLTTVTGFALIGSALPANTTSYTDTGLTSGTTYFYRVSAHRAAQDGDPAFTSAASAEASATPPPIPDPPTNLGATATSPTSVSLTWTDGSSNETQFRIRRKSGAGTFAQVGTTAQNVTSFNDTTVGDGTSYDYAVTAVNVAGDSTAPPSVNVVTPLPTPGNLTAAPINATTIRLNWNDLSANESNFRVERRLGSGAYTVIAASLPANSTSYDDSTGLTVGLDYTYQVTAWNSTISSGASTSATTRLQPLPAAASNLNATPTTSTAVQLTWTDNSDNESGFRISRKTGSGGTYATIATVAPNTTSHTSSGLSEGTQYFYRVTAFNVSGDAANSNEDSATTRSNAPTNLAATIINSTSVRLNWSDGSTTETGFSLRRNTGSGSFSEIAQLPPNTTTYLDTGLVSDTSYGYRVFATNGGGLSASSEEATVTPPSIPAAASSLVATATSTSKITLTWTDNSTNESGFRIQRAAAATGPWTTVRTNVSNVNTWEDNDLTENTTYHYQVITFNAGGDASPSNSANATTQLGPPAAPSGLVATTRSPTQVTLTWIDNATNETSYKVQRRDPSSSVFADIATLSANVTLYDDKASQTNVITNGLTYTYRVIAINATSTAPSNDATTTTGVTPPTPTNLQTQVVSSSVVTLNWNDAGTTESGFRIRRRIGIDGVETVVGLAAMVLTTGGTYTDTNLKSGTNYYYTVTSFDLVGESLPTSAVLARTIETFPLPASNVTATAASASRVDVSWTDNADNETSFKVQRKTGGGAYADASAELGPNVTTFSDTNGVLPLTTYNYRVITTNTIGSEFSTNEATVTTPIAAPTAPTSFTATIVSSFQLNLNWGDAATNETGYRLYRQVGTGEFTLYQTLGAGTTSFQDFGLDEGVIYSYRLAAYNSSGESTPYAVATVTMPILPGPPTNLVVAKKNANSLELAWVQAAQGGDETGFRILRKSGSGSFALLTTTAANVFTYIDTGLAQNTNYVYRVIAFNQGGDSDGYAEGNQTTPIIPPPPTITTVTPISYKQITVNWTYPATDPVTGLTQVQFGLDGFILQRSTSLSGPFTTVSSTIQAADRSFTEDNLISKRVYYYRVLAKTAYDQSLVSNILSAETLDGPPDSPTNLVAAVLSPTTIQLTWSDNSNNETGFVIQRNTTGTDPWTDLVTQPANTLTYSDNDISLVPGTRYYYRVKATNSSATPPDSLNYTNVANASLPTQVPGAPTGLTVGTRTPTSITLNWNYANPANEISIKIERKPLDSTAAYSPIATITSVAIGTYTDTGLTEGTSFSYRLVAQNIVGSSTGVLIDTATLTVAPTNLVATVDTFTSARLTWVDNSLTNSTYKIYQRLSSESNFSEYPTVLTGTATTQLISGLLSGSTYFFKVVSVRVLDESADSNIVSLALPTKPTAPTTLVATTNPTTPVSRIDLQWIDRSNNETGFRIERRTATTSFALVTTVGAGVTQYADSGLVSGTDFIYRIAAVNAGGFSDWSNEVGASTEGYPPNAPTNLVATAVSGSQINISWNDNSDNEAGFRVQRRQIPTSGSPGAWLTIATVNPNITAFQNTNLIPGRTYAYRVTAFNNDGDATSNEAQAFTPRTVPAAPNELTATAISGFQINLAWNDNSGTEDGFRIFRKASLSGTFAQIGEVLADVRTYQDTGLTPNTRYYYQVIAFNDVGVSAASNEISATTLVTPNAPSNLVATAFSSTQINLSWTDNSINESGFKIQRRTGTNGIWVEVGTVSSNIKVFQNTGLTPGQSYVYRVVSYTPTSDSAPSNEASATTPVGVPTAPGNLQAVTISFSQINLTWSDNSGNETSFIIRRKAGSAGTYSDIATVAANVTSYQDTGLAASVTYYYVVIASNTNGNSAPSNETFATTSSGGSQVPTAPSNLVATAISATQINLTWSDNSGNETGFRIRRRTGLDGAWSDIATTGLDTTTYSDTALTPGTTYYYSVRGTNAIGDSALSNEANATTSSGSTTPLAPPTNLQVTAMTVSSTRLTWTDTSSAESGFRIQRRQGTDGAWGDITTTAANATSHEDTGLLSNASYTYRVFAINSGGSSDPSNEHSITIPTFNFEVLSNGQPSSNAVGRNQSKYYRIYVPTGASELLVQTSGNNNVNLYVRYERQPQITANCRSEGSTSAEQCRLVSPNAGDWHVQVLGNASSTSNFTVTATYQGGGTVSVPGAPSALVATPTSSTQVNLTWLDGATNETGFRIRRRLSSSPTWSLIATVDPNVINYVDTGLTPGSTYSYYVTAINIAGESANSNEASATTPSSGGSAPTAPGNLVTATISSSQINLSWTDNSTTESGFRIRRRTGTSGFGDVATVAANVTTYQNTGLAAGTTYVYQVVSYNDFGTSAGSNESTATTTSSGGGGTGTPTAPSGLIVSAASTTTVNLSWDDNSTNEGGFRIERKLGVGEWSTVGTLGANIETWLDTGLIATANLTYRVVAFNSTGSSTPSEERSVTVPSFNFTTITNNELFTGSVSRSSSRFYKIYVPPGTAELTVETTEGTFDPNLYLRVDRQPTEVAYNCRSISSGAIERCRVLTPVPGDWHIMVIGNTITTSNFILRAKIIEAALEFSNRQN